ncbi:MAG: hypothetical protein AAFV93_08220 [Chloroflexota bacterium]
MHIDPDPTLDDDIDPQYNPATLNADDSPVDELILNMGVPEDDIDPEYNPATMDFAEEDED